MAFLGAAVKLVFCDGVLQRDDNDGDNRRHDSKPIGSFSKVKHDIETSDAWVNSYKLDSRD